MHSLSLLTLEYKTMFLPQDPFLIFGGIPFLLQGLWSKINSEEIIFSLKCPCVESQDV